MQQTIHDLMQKEMSRKEFLGVLGFGLASVFGLSTILQLLGHKPQIRGGGDPDAYGSSAYGGSR